MRVRKANWMSESKLLTFARCWPQQLTVQSLAVKRFETILNGVFEWDVVKVQKTTRPHIFCQRVDVHSLAAIWTWSCFDLLVSIVTKQVVRVQVRVGKMHPMSFDVHCLPVSSFSRRTIDACYRC